MIDIPEMSAAGRAATLQWARERVGIEHDSPARDAAIMLLTLTRTLHYATHPIGPLEECAHCAATCDAMFCNYCAALGIGEQ